MKKISIISVLIILCFSSCIYYILGEDTDDNIMSVYVKNDTSYTLIINDITINIGDSVKLTTKNFPSSKSSENILQNYLHNDLPDTLIIRNIQNDKQLIYLKYSKDTSEKTFYDVNYWQIYEYREFADDKRYCIFNINDEDFAK